MSVASEFKAFVLRGNVVDLAIGVVIGAAFTSVVTAFVKDLITPLLAIPGKTAMDFSGVYFTIGGGRFLVGEFINAVIAFLIVAVVLFFFVVRPTNTLMARFRPTPQEPATTRPCPECLSSIPIAARRCAFCTTELAETGPAA